MAIDDKIGKWEAFKIIVGKDVCKGEFPGDVPEFNIPHKNVDKVYLTVKKMQRCYYGRTDPVAAYYSSHFHKVEGAYLSRNFYDFRAAVKGLMVAIDSE